MDREPLNETSNPSYPARGALAVLALYRATLSPTLPPACRFVPSCSVYAAQAIRAHGLARGIVLAAARLFRCHPWGGCGLDPIPPRGTR